MIIALSPRHSHIIAQIHKEALAGDFLPSLGQEFLTTLYSGVLDKLGIFGFGYKVDDEIVGFVVGATNIKKFYSLALKHKFFPLTFHLIKRVISNPSIIKKILETLFYPKKEVGPQAELVVIAVDNKFQGRGMGLKLTQALERAFKKDKISRYKLTVHADKKAVGFYEHLGYSRIKEFSLYGKMWFVYEKDIGLPRSASRKSPSRLGPYSSK